MGEFKDVQSFLSHNVAIWENRFKMFHTWHLIPAKLHKIFPHLDGRCWRSQENDADLMHIWWKCGKLKVFWRQVHATVQMILEIELPWTQRVMLLADIVDKVVGR